MLLGVMLDLERRTWSTYTYTNMYAHTHMHIWCRLDLFHSVWISKPEGVNHQSYPPRLFSVFTSLEAAGGNILLLFTVTVKVKLVFSPPF